MCLPLKFIFCILEPNESSAPVLLKCGLFNSLLNTYNRLNRVNLCSKRCSLSIMISVLSSPPKKAYCNAVSSVTGACYAKTEVTVYQVSPGNFSVSTCNGPASRFACWWSANCLGMENVCIDAAF